MKVKSIMVALAALVGLPAFAALEIQCVADGSTGEYCGEGYGISVSVSTPASGYTIKYSETGDGNWLDELKYVNVCTDKPIYYQVTASGYTTKTGSAKVTVTPKELTNDYIGLVLPSEDYVYDGEPKEPEVSYGDGDPSILTEDDWEVSYENNVNVGTATATFTGKGNYTGECYEDFEILKADNEWTIEPTVTSKAYDGTPADVSMGAAKSGTVSVTYDGGAVAAPVSVGDHAATFIVDESQNYKGLTKIVNYTITKAAFPGGGEEPGGGTVPAGGVSKFDAVAMYDGEGHTIKTNDLIVAFKAAVGGEVGVKYARGGAEGPVLPWLSVAPDFTNVCVTSVWYKVTSANYQDFTHEAKVAVTNRPVTLTSGTQSFDYDGNVHSNMMVTVGGEGFVAGEGVTSNNFATITEKGTKPNAFDYEWILNPGSVAENYLVTCVTGMLTVASVANAWLVDPTVTSKTYDRTPAAVTMGTPKFGTVSVAYDGGQTAAPVAAGDHTATFTVAATENYGALEKVMSYTIQEAMFAIDDGTGGEGGENSRFSYKGRYDHEGHGIAVRVDNPPEGYVIKYAVGTIAEPPAEGWTDVNPLFTNVCDRTVVWYAVECEGFVSYTNKATVTIAPLFLYAEPQTHINVEGGEIAPYKAAASVYDGYLCEWGAVFGSVQVKVSKEKVNKKNGKFEAKVTATVQLADGSKKISFKGGIADETGTIGVMTKDGHALEVSVGVNGLGGIFRHSNGTAYLIDGARNVFKGKSVSDKTVAKAAVERYSGVYNTAFEDGVLSFSVGKNGKTKISGTVQGAKVNLTSQLLVGDGIAAIPVVIIKKVRLALCLWLMEDGAVVAYGDRSADAGFASAIGISGEGDALRSGARFALGEITRAQLLATFSGLYVDYLPNGVAVSQNGKKWIVADGAKTGKLVLLDKATGALDPEKTKVTANMSGLKLMYKVKDGTFKGSFKLYNFENGKIKAYTANVTGVMIGAKGYGTATIKKPSCSFPITIE